MNTLAQIAGDGLVHNLFVILLVGICLGIVYAVGRWFLGKLGAPSIGLTIWDGLFVLVGAIVVINFLLSLAGHPFIVW